MNAFPLPGFLIPIRDAAPHRLPLVAPHQVPADAMHIVVGHSHTPTTLVEGTRTWLPPETNQPQALPCGQRRRHHRSMQVVPQRSTLAA